MAVIITKPALNLRALLAQLADLKPPPLRHTFWTSGDASTTSFDLAAGWVVRDVFVGGSIQRPGAGEDYTVSTADGVATITFAVAPAAVDIAFMAECEVSS